jgi:hypothetical protein
MIRKADLYLPVSDEACVGAGGNYYLNTYDAVNMYEPHVHQASLGKQALKGPEEILDRADKVTAAMADSYQFDSHKNVKPVAASLLRLCTRHDEPVIEIAENVIRVIPGQTSLLTIEPAYGFADPYTVNVGLVSAPTGPTDFHLESDVPNTFYLPHENYDGLHSPHQAVKAHTGGSSYPVRFGLLGGEELVEVSPNPKI